MDNFVLWSRTDYWATFYNGNISVEDTACCGQNQALRQHYNYHLKFLYTKKKIMKLPSSMQSNTEGQLTWQLLWLKTATEVDCA